MQWCFKGCIAINHACIMSTGEYAFLIEARWRTRVSVTWALTVSGNVVAYHQYTMKASADLILLSSGCSSASRVYTSSHYTVVIMSANASQITGVSIVYSRVCSGADQRKHQSSASLAFVTGIHRWSVNSPHKGPVTRTMFPFWWRHHHQPWY